MATLSQRAPERERRLAGGPQLLDLLGAARGAVCHRDLVRTAASRGLDRQVVDRWLQRAQAGGIVDIRHDGDRPVSTASRLVELTSQGRDVAARDRRASPEAG